MSVSRIVLRVVPCVVLALALAAPPGRTQSNRNFRAERGDAGTVRGPLSDFWFKIRSEWAGYREAEGNLPPGGGQLQQRTLLTPAPNRVWVSLVYGDRLSRRKKGPLAHLYTEFLSEFKRAEGRNWPYAQIYGRPWSRMSAVGRRQNIIMIGTPWELPPVGPLAGRMGITIRPGLIRIGGRSYRGDNLILVFIAPNPVNARKYALVISGSHDEALLQAGHLPYGGTDYVLFRGRRLLESGHFSKTEGGWGAPVSWAARDSHHGFSIRETEHYTFWYETGRLAHDDLEAIVRQKEESYPALTAIVAAPGGTPRRLTYFLYPSIDRKIDETSRDEAVHIDLASREIHTVFSRHRRILEPYLDLMVLLHDSIGPTRVPRLERALAIALAPRFQGRDLEDLAARIFSQTKPKAAAVLKSIRDQQVMTPADGPPSSLDLLLAAFLERLIREHGSETVVSFVAGASPRDLSDAFKAAFRSDLGEALLAWTESLGRAAPGGARTAEAAGADGPANAQLEQAMDLIRLRRDGDAARALETLLVQQPDDPQALSALARVRFRHGRFEEAARHAHRAIESCGSSARDACVEAEAWAHLTLGRVEALKGRHIAAHVELTHAAVRRGPGPVPTLADYWLHTMGQSRNQLTVTSHLKREARVSLRRLDWRRAEKELKQALEIDPTDGEAHRLLSEVYHKQHEYWSWRVRYLNQIHPDYNVLSRMYFPDDGPIATRVEPLHSVDAFNDLVFRGNLELLKAQSLYAVEIQNLHAEGDRHLIEENDLDEAMKLYRRALALNEDFFLSHFLVGRCFFLMDRRVEARAAFEEVLHRRPTDALVLAWTHTYLGYLSLEEDQLKRARRSFTRALSIVEEGKVAALAREGLDSVETIQLLRPNGPSGR